MKNLFLTLFCLSLFAANARANLLESEEGGASYVDQLHALYERGQPLTREETESVLRENESRLEGHLWLSGSKSRNHFVCRRFSAGPLFPAEHKCSVYESTVTNYTHFPTTLIYEDDKTWYLFQDKKVVSYRTVEVDSRKYLILISFLKDSGEANGDGGYFWWNEDKGH